MKQATVTYTNWKGARGMRTIMPLTLRWGTCPYHGEQAIWLLDGIDVDKQAMRTFSWADFGSDAERAILREILLGNTVHASRKGITN